MTKLANAYYLCAYEKNSLNTIVIYWLSESVVAKMIVVASHCLLLCTYIALDYIPLQLGQYILVAKYNTYDSIHHAY